MSAHEDLAKRAAVLLPFMVEVKTQMAAVGARSWQARCPMPDCKGVMHVSVVGKSDHVRMRCESCGASMME
jgi:hypothetical protein